MGDGQTNTINLEGARLTSLLLWGADFTNPQDYLELRLQDGNQVVCRGKRQTREGGIDAPMCSMVSGRNPKFFRLDEANSGRLFEIERVFVERALKGRSEALKKLKAHVKKIGSSPQSARQVFDVLSRYNPRGSCKKEEPLPPIESTLTLLGMVAPRPCDSFRLKIDIADLTFAAGFLAANELLNISQMIHQNDPADLDVITTVNGVRFAIMDIRWIEFPPEK